MYPALRRLQLLGLAVAEIDRRAELRLRTVYRPTQAGNVEHDRWLFEPIDPTRIGRYRGLLLLRFVFMEGRASRKKVLAFLDELKDALEAYVADLQQHLAATDRASRHQRLALQHGVAAYQASLAWADSAVAEVRRSRTRPPNRVHTETRETTP